MSNIVTLGIKRSLKWFRSAYWLHNVLWVGLLSWFLLDYMSWWMAIGLSYVIYGIGYVRGREAEDRDWQPRYEKLREHHSEGLRKSCSKIKVADNLELQTRLGARKGVVAPHAMGTEERSV